MQYKIYQMKNTDSNKSSRFCSLETAKRNNPNLNLLNYDLVYTSELDPKQPESDRIILDELFHTFNLNRPDDFHGHSLSVSDIIEIDGRLYYVNSFGFKRIDSRLSRARERNR